jgi:hypothetical protein
VVEWKRGEGRKEGSEEREWRKGREKGVKEGKEGRK